jgi:hypothetical protein
VADRVAGLRRAEVQPAVDLVQRADVRVDVEVGGGQVVERL